MMISVGFGNLISKDRIVAIVSYSSAPMKRIKEDAKNSQKLIDATSGRKTRSVIITDSNHIILSALEPQTIAQRLNTSEERESEISK